MKVQGLSGRKIKVNIGFFILLVLACYVCYSAYSSFKKSNINYYEVVEGGMAKDTEHTGIALRTENTQYTKTAGYINYFVNGGKRVGVGTQIYTIDETGAMSSFLASNADFDTDLSEESIDRIKKNLNSFATEFEDNNFSHIYNAKIKINASLLDATGTMSSEMLDELMSSSGISFSRVYSPVVGTISYDIDGYEERTSESITIADFDNQDYSMTHLKSGQMIENGAPAYKVITDEQWELVFPITEEEREILSGYDTLKVKFNGTNINATGTYTQLNSMDGNAYGKLTFNKYMVNFIDDRYIDFHLDLPSNSGLKIPKSAVITKTFLLVPTDYLARGGDNTDQGFYKEILTDSGTSIEYVPCDIFYSTDDYYYVDLSSKAPLQPGDYVVKPGTTERYKLGETASREGVYNINKGYAVFKQIDIIDSNDEFYTVKKNQKYGLSVYDHILYDPSGVNEGDFIYQ